MTTISLAAVGDIMLGDHPVCFGHGVRSRLRQSHNLDLFQDVAPILRSADIATGNLECVLSNLGHNETSLRSSELRGDPTSARLLKECGFNILSIANNHMLQHGPEALADTTTRLVNNGIQPIGLYQSGFSNVATIRKGSLSIRLIAASLRPENYYKGNNRYYYEGSPEQLVSQVRQLHLEQPDSPIVVSLHWGEEYLHTPSIDQIELAHRLAEEGAALIIGHHPHVLQGIEHYGSAVIAYSLGNFIFDSWQAATRRSVVLQCTLGAAGVLDFSVTPFFIDKRYQLTTSDMSKNKSIRGDLDAFTSSVVDRTGLAALPTEEYARAAASAYNKYRIECYLYFVRNLWRYSPRIVLSSLLRALLRRLRLA